MDAQPTGPSIGFLLEQTLGHVSHGRNLQRTLAETTDAQIRWRELSFESTGLLDRLPPRSNWTVRSSLNARAAVRDLQREAPLDALFVHTHVPAALLGPVMARIPTVISVDATPHQIDALGSSYSHRVHSGPLEDLKGRVHRACFRRAASLVAWSQWAADSLVTDYGADRDRIEVIPPGVIPSQWRRPRSASRSDDIVRILFVGGDFERKGGNLLLEAVARLNNDPDVQKAAKVELHLVTTGDVEPREDVHVHRGLTPNSAPLIELYHRCDIFALPTRGDCTPLVLAEAACAGLPAVATDVGAIRETVIDGVTGHLAEPDVESLTAALRRLVVDPAHRRTLGDNAAEHAARTMDAERNAHRLLRRLVAHARPEPSVGRVLLTVSGEIASDLDDATSAGERPLADYAAIARATGADLLDRRDVRTDGSKLTGVLGRAAGSDVAMAFHTFRQRRQFDVVITDGEQIGLPLALMLRLGGRGGSRHVMIGHRLSVRKKSVLTRVLALSRGVDEVLVYSTHQYQVAQQLFGRPGQRVRLIDFMVDTEFFRPDQAKEIGAGGERPSVVTAGREFRDYPTLIEAVRDLDLDVVIASASPWSKRSDNAHDVDLPPNVTITSLSQRELRDQLAQADVVVMPLLPVDFQAGITTILEAMAMARPVICSSTIGQIDVVVDGDNGRYVPPGDVAALRTALQDVLADPETAAAMGARGRDLVEKRADVRVYAATFAEIVRWHLGTARALPGAVEDAS